MRGETGYTTGRLSVKCAVTIIVLAALAGNAAAQMAPIDRVPVIQPSPGERVRLNYALGGPSTVHGTWVGLDPHGVRLLRAPQDTAQVALDRLVSLERSTGTQRHTGVGLLLGAVVGGMVGFLAAPEDEAAESWGMGTYSRMYYGGVGALIGGLAGGVLGASIKTDRWEVVPLRPADQ